MTYDFEPNAGEPDSRGCRLLVASYSDVAPVVRAVAVRARDRILQSPTLGDFINISFADLGPQPRQREEPDKAGRVDMVTRIVTTLTQASQDADLSFFALLIADRSAAAAADVLASCDADPVIGALPMRCRILASVDDRPRGTNSAAEVKLPPGTSWNRDGLVDEVEHYAKDLLTFFSARQQRGLTTAELGALRPLAAELDEQSSDALIPSTPASVPEPSPQKSEPTVPASTSAGRPRLLSFARLHVPRARREPAPETGPPAKSVVVYLILIVAESAPDRAGWHRGRSVLLELDQRLAETPGIAYLTRVLDATVPGEDRLQPAGRLSERDIRHPVSSLDFATALANVPIMLRSDYQRAIQTTPLTAPLVLVIYAAGAPLADTITYARYAALAAKVPILWVLPDPAARLLSAAFRDGMFVHVSTDHRAIGAELLTLIAEQTQDRRASEFGE